MDGTDEKLIALLKEEPRATNRVLAAKLGVSEPTVASRISKLEEANCLRIVARLDMQAAGFEHFVVFGMRIIDRHPDQAALEIAQVPEVNGLTLTFGRFEIVGTLFAHDKADLIRLIDHTLGMIRGVQGLESGLILRVHRIPTDVGTLSVMAEGPQPIAVGCVLDPLDLGIIECLQEDGRMSYREVGRRMGAPEATIRSRVRRLEASGNVTLRAVTDVDVSDSEASAWVALRVHGGSLDNIVERVSKMVEVGFLATALGRFNLVGLVVLPSRAALLDFIFERVAPLHGIQQIETWEVVRSYKHDIRVGPRVY